MTAAFVMALVALLWCAGLSLAVVTIGREVRRRRSGAHRDGKGTTMREW